MAEASAQGEFRPGRVVADRYRVVGLIGSGGMGAVYEAEHLELGNRVALKVMLPRFGENAGMLQRFINEARAAARIGHPGIVQVFDLGRDEGATFIAMEKLDGEELQQRIDREGRLDVAAVIRIGIELADAVAAAHEHGIVHRDLKPSNVFLCKRPRGAEAVKVLDFGIAKLSHELEGGDTRTGAVLGTPLYMPPEQLKSAKHVDPRSDVYAIGAVLYHALVGAPPFDAATWPELAYQIASVAPVAPRDRRAEVPAWLSDLVMQALEKEPALRPSSAKALADALSDSKSRGSTISLDQTQPLEAAEGATTPVAARSDDHLAPLASTTPDKPPQRWWLWVGGGVLVVGVGTALVMRNSPAVDPATALASAPSAEPAPMVSASESPPASAAPPVSAAAPTRVGVRFVTVPKGASISIDGEPACSPTPCTAEVTAEPHSVSAELRGFGKSGRALSLPLPERVELTLEPKRATTPRTSKPPSGGPAPPPLRPP